MSRGRSVLVLAIIVLLGAGVIWLLSGGGGTRGISRDPKGDVAVSEGTKPPETKSLVDLRRGAITVEGETATFEATVATEIPGSLKNEAATFRWEVLEDDQVTWIVTANVDVGHTASILATQRDYRGSTIDGSLPGELFVQNERVSVTLEIDELEGFPRSFGWTLQTELDGDRETSPSALATDRIPDSGSLQVSS